MAAYDHYDAPGRERDRRDYDRPRYDAHTRERESQHLKPYPSASRDLVRQRDSDLSVEEVRREFPPPGFRNARRARSADPGYYDYDPRYEQESRGRRVKGPESVYYQEEEERRKRMLSKQEKILAAFAGAALALGGKEAYDRYEANQEGHEVERNYLQSAALGAAGAFAGYQGAEFYSKHATKEEKKTRAVYQGRDGRYEYYSDDDTDGTAKKGHKKFLESVLGVTSMGAAMKMLTGGDDKSSRRGRSRSSSRSSRSRGQSRSKLQKAAMASLIAGATEAFRISKEPGGWKGEKAKRVVTAAIGAGALGGAHNEGHSKKDILESVLGGLVGNRVLHGSKSNIEADDRDPGRSRSRSRARSSSRGGGGSSGKTGLAALATAGLTALTAKKALDGRDRSRSRRRESNSDGSRSPSRRHRSRSRSVVDSARKSLAKFGLGGGPTDRDDSDQEDSRHGGSRRRRHSENDYDDHRGSSRREKSRDRGGYHDDYDDRSRRPRHKGSRSDAGSETDLGDSSEDEKRAKKMRGKQILTTGLAAVATIHAAHEVYQSMEKRQARHQAVREGRLSPEEAKRLKTKAIVQDVASVGVAAISIKGAVSELKEARHIQTECKEFQREKQLRHKRRLERMKQPTGSNRGRRRADNWSTSTSSRLERYDNDYAYDDDGYYTDGNPYAAALPAPPVGHNGR